MAGHAGQLDREPGCAGNRGYHSDRQILGFQHRPLLDVEFDIGKQFAAGPRGRSDMVGIETELEERIAYRYSGAVLYAKQALVERSGDRAAPQQRGGESNAFLIGKTGHLDSEGQWLSAPVYICNAGNRRNQPKRPVPFACVTYGIVVRAEHEAGQTRTFSFVAAADVSDGIEMRAHSRLSHPRQQQISRGAVLGGEKDTGQIT